MVTLENVVAKFGGTSLADAKGVRGCVDITIGKFDGRARKSVVVSAPAGITNWLIALGRHRLGEGGGQDTSREIAQRFASIIQGYGLEGQVSEDYVERLLRQRADASTSIKNHAAYKDQLHALGEEAMATIFALALRKEGLQARVLMPQDIGFYVTSTFGDARVLPESFANIGKAAKQLGANEFAAYPGYFAVTKEGKIVTFERGGSDTVGSIIANGVGADFYEKWTDQDGIGVLSPSVNGNGQSINIQRIGVMTYEEAVLLTNAGFRVLHPDSIKPAKEKSIPIAVRNSMNPSHSGTVIIDNAPPSSLATGIAYKGGFVSVSCWNPYDIELRNDVISGLRAELSKKGIRPALITSQNGESLIYDQERLNSAALNDAKRSVFARLKEERPEAAAEVNTMQLNVTYGNSLVSVVGRGMQHNRRTVDERVFEGIRQSGVEARLVGDDEISRVLLIREDPLAKEPENAKRVAVGLYKQFFPN
ncbi:hypothetical protein HYV83_02095 [Candidatus Woesearchaeota archaeon]|nr:hypothetical protein [Candidatus Woesearchaeota archaeon]